MKKYIKFLIIIAIHFSSLFGEHQQKKIIIGIEGIPGAGKTSTLVALVQKIRAENCILIPELNLAEDTLNSQNKELSKIYHELWKERLHILQETTFEDGVFLTDRTYFSNLAFTYAFTFQKDPSEYQLQKEIVRDELGVQNFDLIFFFDTTPQIGLQRREKNGDFPPYPWSNLSFLNRFREFYHRELPCFYSGELISILTDDLSSNQLLERVYNEIMKRFGNHLKTSPIHYNSDQEEHLLLEFASTCPQLGPPYSHGFHVKGYPTIYFRQFAIVLEADQPLVLNNHNLKHLLNHQSPPH